MNIKNVPWQMVLLLVANTLASKAWLAVRKHLKPTMLTEYTVPNMNMETDHRTQGVLYVVQMLWL